MIKDNDKKRVVFIQVKNKDQFYILEPYDESKNLEFEVACEKFKYGR